MTVAARSALDARRLYNYLRLMELHSASLRDIRDEADRLAQEGKLA